MKKAVALKYNQNSENAPRVTALGKGELAFKIIQKAKEFDIPLFCNDELVSSLVDLELDKEIPQQLYKAVADVFMWLMRQENKADML